MDERINLTVDKNKFDDVGGDGDDDDEDEYGTDDPDDDSFNGYHRYTNLQ